MQEKKHIPIYKKVGATIAVGGTTALSIILDVGDELSDGALHIAAGINDIFGDKKMQTRYVS